MLTRALAGHSAPSPVVYCVSHHEWTELYNSSGQAVDLGRWALDDETEGLAASDHRHSNAEAAPGHRDRHRHCPTSHLWIQIARAHPFNTWVIAEAQVTAVPLLQPVIEPGRTGQQPALWQWQIAGAVQAPSDLRSRDLRLPGLRDQCCNPSRNSFRREPSQGGSTYLAV